MERIWGGRKLQTYFGRELPSKDPIGESWELVDREDVQSVVSEAEISRSLFAEIWVNTATRYLATGTRIARFPILVKILDASEILSVQVHPARSFNGRSSSPNRRRSCGISLPPKKARVIFVGLKSGMQKKGFRISSGERRCH